MRSRMEWRVHYPKAVEAAHLPFFLLLGQNDYMNAENEVLPKLVLDARTFQKPLSDLTETIALKVQREGAGRGLKPDFVVVDIYFLLRQAQQICDLFFFVNADERRKKDVDWRAAYSVVSLPLIRTMIDCLYNVTAILWDPGVKRYQFRGSGYKLTLEALDADERRYGGDPRWDADIAKRRDMIALGMRMDGVTEAEVKATKTWPTLSGYLRENPVPAPHQEFLRKLTFGFWQEYSGMGHATFQGLLPIALFLAPKDLPHEERHTVDNAVVVMIATHIARLAGILLCTLTEVQAYCRVDGAHINRRLHEVWNALIVVPEIKELYDERYAQLMIEKGIHAD